MAYCCRYGGKIKLFATAISWTIPATITSIEIENIIEYRDPFLISKIIRIKEYKAVIKRIIWEEIKKKLFEKKAGEVKIIGSENKRMIYWNNFFIFNKVLLHISKRR